MSDRTLPAVDLTPVDFRARRRTLYLISVQLAVETLAMVAVCVYAIGRVDWEQELAQASLSLIAMETIGLSLVLLPVAAIAGITAADFLRVGRGAWVRAMIVQGVVLSLCLGLYAAGHASRLVFGGMFYAILVVWYLNTNEVRSAFYARKQLRKVSEPGN
jgi:hypothetical protein